MLALGISVLSFKAFKSVASSCEDVGDFLCTLASDSRQIYIFSEMVWDFFLIHRMCILALTHCACASAPHTQQQCHKKKRPFKNLYADACHQDEAWYCCYVFVFLLLFK